MTKIDIFSGFLGAGKTTLIKKLIKEAFAGQQVVLIENEFGEIGIDGGFLKESGIQINELNAGCICCSLVGDFRTALQQVVEQYHPDRIVIEPSGVGKLSDVTRAVEGVAEHLDVQLNSFVTVADDDAVGVVLLHHLLQGGAEIAHQRAADAAGVQLVDLDAAFLQKAAVNADLAELVLDQHHLLTGKGLFDELFD